MKRVHIIILYTLYLLSLIISLTSSMKFHNEAMELKQQYKKAEFEIEMQQEKTERMIDTCIDLVANRRWENGESGE